MQLLRIPIDHPCGYWTFALALSLYYGIRGIVIQRHSVANENIDERAKKHIEWGPCEQVIVHQIHDFIFNFGSGLAGFAALYATQRIFDGIPNFSAIEGGTAAVLAFLIAIAITGVTGILPMLLIHGKLFGSK